MARMLGTLHEESGGGGGVSFLRTHPSGPDRVRAAIRREAEILLELGSERPAAGGPRLAFVYQATDEDDDDRTRIGEEVARQAAEVARAECRADWKA